MRLCTICVALLLPVAGCGTVANQVQMQRDGGAAGFGGVRHDLDHLAKADAGQPDTGRQLLAVADLPFSVIGDLVMWPYTMLFTHINRDVPIEDTGYTATPVVPAAMMPAPTIPTVPLPTVPLPTVPLPTAPAPQPLPGKN